LNRHEFCKCGDGRVGCNLSYEFFVKFSDEVLEVAPINLAVTSSSPIIEMWVLMNPQKELPAVIPAEGPIFALA